MGFLARAFNVRAGEGGPTFTFFLVTFCVGVGASLSRSLTQTLFMANADEGLLPFIFLGTEAGVMTVSFLYAYLTQKMRPLTITHTIAATLVILLGFVWLKLNFLPDYSLEVPATINYAEYYQVYTQLPPETQKVLQTFYQIDVENKAITFIAGGDKANEELGLALKALGVYTPHHPWIYFFFWFAFNVPFVMISMHMGVFISLHFNALQRKRLVPVIFAGQTSGSVLGGTLLAFLTKVFGLQPDMVVALSPFMFGTVIVITAIAARYYQPIEDMKSKKKKGRKWSEGVKEGFSFVVESKLMLYMTVGSLFFFTIVKVNQYEYLAIYKSFFPDSRDLAAFLGLYEVVGNLTALIIQMTITPRIVGMFGVGSANTLYPSMQVAATALLFLVTLINWFLAAPVMMMYLVAAIFINFVNAESRKTVFTPTRNLLFNGIPTDMWGNAQAFFNGMINPLGTVIATSILLGIPLLIPDANWLTLIFSIVGVIVALVLLFSAIPQKRAYERAVLKMLETRSFDKNQLDQMDFGKLDDKTYSMVIETLNSDEAERVDLGLQLIGITKDDRFLSALDKRYTTAPIENKPKFVFITAKYDNEDAFKMLENWLEQEKSEAGLCALFPVVAKNPYKDLTEKVRAYFDDDNAAIRFTARLALAREDKKFLKEYVLGYLESGDSDIDALRQAIITAGKIDMREAMPHLLKVATDKSNTLRKDALEALSLIAQPGDEELKQVVENILNGRDKNEKTEQHLALEIMNRMKPVNNTRELELLIPYMLKRLPRHRRKIEEVLNPITTPVLEAIQAEVTIHKLNIERKLFLLQLLNDQGKTDPELLIHAGKVHLDYFIRSKMWENRILEWEAGEKNQIGSTLLHIISYQNKGFLELTIRCLVYMAGQGIEVGNNVANGLLSDHKKNRIMALEALSNMNEKHLGSLIYDLFEAGNFETDALTTFASNRVNPEFKRPTDEDMVIEILALDDPYLISVLMHYLSVKNLSSLEAYIKKQELPTHPVIQELI